MCHTWGNCVVWGRSHIWTVRYFRWCCSPEGYGPGLGYLSLAYHASCAKCIIKATLGSNSVCSCGIGALTLKMAKGSTVLRNIFGFFNLFFWCNYYCLGNSCPRSYFWCAVVWKHLWSRHLVCDWSHHIVHLISGSLRCFQTSEMDAGCVFGSDVSWISESGPRCSWLGHLYSQNHRHHIEAYTPLRPQCYVIFCYCCPFSNKKMIYFQFMHIKSWKVVFTLPMLLKTYSTFHSLRSFAWISDVCRTKMTEECLLMSFYTKCCCCLKC